MRKDYQAELSVIEKIFKKSGHLILTSPRYHPELAGQGIEYCWGKAKFDFRNYINDCKAKNLPINVQKALGAMEYTSLGGQKRLAPLSVERVRKFARKARIYCILFDLFSSPAQAQQALEHLKKGESQIKMANGETIEFGILKDDASVHDMLKQMYKLGKTHCSMLDKHSSLFSRSDD